MIRTSLALLTLMTPLVHALVAEEGVERTRARSSYVIPVLDGSEVAIPRSLIVVVSWHVIVGGGFAPDGAVRVIWAE